jgi:RecB family exonuclease
VLCEIDGFHFIGFIDRLDSYMPGEVRIVDYKTGRVEDNDLLIDDTNAPQIVEQLFGADVKARPKIALQLFLYDHMAPSVVPAGSRLVNSIYSTARLYSQPLPDVPVSAEFSRLALDGLHALLAEIVDPSVPFRRTSDTTACDYCDFKAICGR